MSMKMKILVLLSSFLISIVISHPVMESGIDDVNITEYGKDLKSVHSSCRINQYFDKEESKCKSIIGGGKAIHVNNLTSCGVNTLKPHCSSPRYYYICAGSKIILAQCPDGRHYEDRLQKCVLVPGYKYVPITDQSNSNGLPICESPGSFPAPDDCSLFYTCTKNFLGMHQTFYRCPKEMIYDVETGLCSPSSTCDKSTLPVLCPLNSSVISNEAKRLVRRSKPTGQEKRTTIICRIIYLSEAEGTTESIDSKVTTSTDSLITDHSPATTESITEFQITSSENPYAETSEPSQVETNPSLILTSTEDYYENTLAFTSTDSVTSFDSILSDSEITSEPSTVEERFDTTQNIGERESNTPSSFSDFTYNTTMQMTREVDEYTTSNGFVSESRSSIVPNLTSDTVEEQEDPIITSVLPFSVLNENEHTTTDHIKFTDINEESSIPLNDSTTESNSEETSKLNDGIGTWYITEVATDATTRKYDSAFSSTDAATDFNTAALSSSTEGIGFNQSTEITFTTDDLSGSITSRDINNIIDEETTADSVYTSTTTDFNNTPINESNAFLDLPSIPRGSDFVATTADPVTNSQELSTGRTSDVTENGVTVPNSWNTDNNVILEPDENVTKARTTISPQQIRTISKNIMQPIASAVLNVTDKLERYVKAMLINYFARYA